MYKTLKSKDRKNPQSNQHKTNKQYKIHKVMCDLNVRRFVRKKITKKFNITGYLL